MSPRSSIAPANTALIVAHPDHELRMYRWFQLHRPTTYILTDGSGRTGSSRLHATTRLVNRVGARVGNIYGRHTDRDVYQSVLELRYEWFHQLIDDLTSALVRQEVKFVLGDAAEGEFMSHDIWQAARLVAVQRAEHILGWPIVQYEFPVDSHPLNCPKSVDDEKIHLQLDAERFSEKVEVAYEYVEVRQFVDEMLAAFGKESFQTESLFPSCQESLMDFGEGRQPKYELLGEQLAAEGVYPDVIRYEDHVRPLIESFRAIAKKAA